MPRYADIDTVRDALYEADAITMKGVRILNQFPTISPDEARGVGKWIWHDNLGWDDSLECSCCAEEFVVYDGEFPGIDSFKFCPNCGARMEVSEDA